MENLYFKVNYPQIMKYNVYVKNFKTRLYYFGPHRSYIYNYEATSRTDHKWSDFFLRTCQLLDVQTPKLFPYFISPVSFYLTVPWILNQTCGAFSDTPCISFKLLGSDIKPLRFEYHHYTIKWISFNVFESHCRQKKVQTTKDLYF